MTKKAYSDWRDRKDLTVSINTVGLRFNVIGMVGVSTCFPSVCISTDNAHFEFMGDYVLIQRSRYYTIAHHKDIKGVHFYTYKRCDNGNGSCYSYHDGSVRRLRKIFSLKLIHNNFE